jgi:hypothetical protein
MKSKLALIALFGAFGIVAVGFHYKIPLVIGLTILGLALFGAGWGLQMIVTRKAKIPMSDDFDPTYEVHSGLAAFLYGIVVLAFSVPFVALGAGYLIYGDEPPREILERLFQGRLVSAAITIVVGLCFIFGGLTRVVPGSGAIGGRLQRWSTAISFFTVGSTLTFVTIMRMMFPGKLSQIGMAALTFLVERAK